jgi:hypothetical protein
VLVVVALIIGMGAVVGTFVVVRHGETTAPTGAYLFLFPLTMILALFPLISITFSMRIRVERANGEIFRLFTLFGHEVWRQRFRLSNFDRVSLNRSFRGGYLFPYLGVNRNDRLRNEQSRQRTGTGGRARRRMWAQGQRPPIESC